MSRSQQFPRRSATTAVIFFAVITGCSPTAIGSGSPLTPPTASLAIKTPSPSPTSSPPEGLASTDAPATEAPAGAVRVQLAGPPPHFEPADLTATAGDVDFFLDNTSIGTHTLAIGPALNERLVVSRAVLSGQAAVFTVHALKRGQYMIWCTIDGHAAEGMVGTLNVK
jgi:plastocyanin